MLIYIVSHYWDNGESYEDYDHYEEHKYYSSLELASQSFWRKASEDYEGKYILKSKELDTQGEELLEETPYIECSSVYDNWGNLEESEIYTQEEDCPHESHYYDTYDTPYESYQEEIRLENEWLHSIREQCAILDSIDRDKFYDAIKESDAVWNSLGMLD